ncbi:hypothetical protein BZARG_2494 [Bizionia argentinensis JUB59]|uniref:T9SS C-terminal target domain-containing protein n=1 Tax=Bizionia argentinensis JUB59 TaxID=1046627 RepID=G2ECJ7_9FLAO|nr:hypothetical protein [Bizionia argentinensis]EGV43884.1 hypothetical protein BZARG_2494 [Bizionia argentinensis JUB59]
MKNLTQLLSIFLLVFCNAYSQQEKGIIGTDNWLNSWTEFNPDSKEYAEATEILTGNISADTKLVKQNTYKLLGNVFLTNGATLTIEPGTVIIGDFKTNGSLIITKGATIIADGLVTDPIVFTSSRSVKKAGDWGGIVILGDAPINKFGNGASVNNDFRSASYDHISYGGENIESNSGILRYVRIEYAGKKLTNGNNFNALLLAGVGNQTVLDNIMISFAAGNSFDIFGGEVNLSKAVSFKSNRIDFNFNYGAQSNLHNSLAVRSSYISSPDGSRCLNVASYDNDKGDIDFSKKQTAITATNITFLTASDDLETEISMGLVKEAIFIGEYAELDMSKSVISGFNPAVLFEDKIRINSESLARVKFSEMYFNNCNGNIFIEYNTNNEDLESWYGNSSFFNVYSKGLDAETFIDIKSSRKPDFRLRINKIIASNKY